jgi:predicted amidohydrolase
MSRPGLRVLLLCAGLLAGQSAGVGAASAAGSATPNCSGAPDAVLTGGGQVRVFAMQHKQDLAEDATYAAIRQSLDCELAARVDPYRATDHPNLVVYNELNGLAYGTEGTRGLAARTAGAGATFVDQVAGIAGAAAIGSVAPSYHAPFLYYVAKFGPPAGSDQAIGLFFTSITDTLVRATVDNLSALARKHGVYIVFGTPLVVREGAACTGRYAGWPACPGWHTSSNPVDIAALQDPDIAPVSSVYVADSNTVDNVELFFAPDGTLYDMQPKVNLTSIEISPLGWHQANASTIHAIGLHGPDAVRFPAVRMGVGISLDAFETSIGATPCPGEPDPLNKPNPYPQFMQCLDSKGVNLFIQPEFNDGSKDCVSWTDFTEDCGSTNPPPNWQPLSWMRSAWFAVQGRTAGGAFVFPHFQYAVNPFMVGNLFDITGDGQSAIFARGDPRAVNGWYAGDRSAALYSGTGVGVYTDRTDDPRYARFEGAQPGFLALTPWVIPESSPAAAYRCKPASPASKCPAGALPAGDPGSLQSCEKGLAPGSGVTSGNCAENQYRSTVLVADLFPAAGTNTTPSIVASSSPSALPLTGSAGAPWPLWFAVLVAGGIAAGPVLAAAARRRRARRLL